MARAARREREAGHLVRVIVEVPRPRGRAKVGPVIYTIGYELRDQDELVGDLLEAGVRVLADIRGRPVSRKPGFGANALRGLCAAHGLEYASWAGLGSTVAQRGRVKATGDSESFFRDFRAYAQAWLGDELDALAKAMKASPTALLCFERVHEECHRCVVAELLADRAQGGTTAIV